MTLVRPLQPWDILLIYCNNQLRKYIAPLLRLAGGGRGGTLFTPFWCLCQNLSLSLFTVIKLLPHKNPEWSSLVADPEAKSSLEIANPTLFISYHSCTICSTMIHPAFFQVQFLPLCLTKYSLHHPPSVFRNLLKPLINWSPLFIFAGL